MLDDVTERSGPFRGFYDLSSTTPAQDDLLNEEWRFENGRISSKDHLVYIKKRLEELFRASEHCDVKLTSATSTFKAHKVILAAGSDYFNVMFSSSWNEKFCDCVELKGITSTGLTAILEFIYTGGFKVTDCDVSELLEAARHCLMSEVTDLVETYIRKVVKVNVTNYLNMFELAGDYGLKLLLADCEPFFNEGNIDRENFQIFFEFAKMKDSDYVLNKALLFTIQSLTDLDSVDRERLFALLDHDDVCVMLTDTNRQGLFTNVVLVEFLSDWVQFDKENRLEYTSELFGKINFVAFEHDILGSISTLPIINECEACQSYIANAQKYISKMATGELEVDSFLVTFSGRNMEMRSINGDVTKTMKDVLPMPGLPSEAEAETSKLNEGSFCTTLDNILYVMSGWLENVQIGEYSGNASCCYSYEPGRNAWKQLEHLPLARTGNTLVGLNDCIYSVGGKTMENHEALNKIDFYDISEGAWMNTSPLPYRYSCPLAAAMDGSIYVSFARAGDDIKVHLKDFYQFDPIAKKWTKRALVPLGRYKDLVASGDRLYMIGVKGVVVGDQCNLKACSYNPSTNQWSVLKTSRSNVWMDGKVQCVSDQDKMYIVSDFIDDDIEKEEDEQEGQVRVHFLDPDSKELTLKKSYDWFPRDGMSSAIIRVPLRMIKSNLSFRADDDSS
jgi:hypothetical protein